MPPILNPKILVSFAVVIGIFLLLTGTINLASIFAGYNEEFVWKGREYQVSSTYPLGVETRLHGSESPRTIIFEHNNNIYSKLQTSMAKIYGWGHEGTMVLTRKENLDFSNINKIDIYFNAKTEASSSTTTAFWTGFRISLSKPLAKDIDLIQLADCVGCIQTSAVDLTLERAGGEGRWKVKTLGKEEIVEISEIGTYKLKFISKYDNGCTLGGTNCFVEYKINSINIDYIEAPEEPPVELPPDEQPPIISPPVLEEKPWYMQIIDEISNIFKSIWEAIFGK